MPPVPQEDQARAELTSVLKLLRAFVCLSLEGVRKFVRDLQPPQNEWGEPTKEQIAYESRLRLWYYLRSCRDLFLRFRVLLRLEPHAEELRAVIQRSSELRNLRRQIHEVHWKLIEHISPNVLFPALPPANISCAIDCLGTGSFPRLPAWMASCATTRILKQGSMFGYEDLAPFLPESAHNELTEKLQDRLKFQYAASSCTKSSAWRVSFSDGFLKLSVKGKFRLEASCTLDSVFPSTKITDKETKEELESPVDAKWTVHETALALPPRGPFSLDSLQALRFSDLLNSALGEWRMRVQLGRDLQDELELLGRLEKKQKEKDERGEGGEGQGDEKDANGDVEMKVEGEEGGETTTGKEEPKDKEGNDEEMGVEEPFQHRNPPPPSHFWQPSWQVFKRPSGHFANSNGEGGEDVEMGVGGVEEEAERRRQQECQDTELSFGFLMGHLPPDQLCVLQDCAHRVVGRFVIELLHQQAIAERRASSSRLTPIAEVHLFDSDRRKSESDVTASVGVGGVGGGNGTGIGLARGGVRGEEGGGAARHSTASGDWSQSVFLDIFLLKDFDVTAGGVRNFRHFAPLYPPPAGEGWVRDAGVDEGEAVGDGEESVAASSGASSAATRFSHLADGGAWGEGEEDGDNEESAEFRKVLPRVPLILRFQMDGENGNLSVRLWPLDTLFDVDRGKRVQGKGKGKGKVSKKGHGKRPKDASWRAEVEKAERSLTEWTKSEAGLLRDFFFRWPGAHKNAVNNFSISAGLNLSKWVNAAIALASSLQLHDIRTALTTPNSPPPFLKDELVLSSVGFTRFLSGRTSLGPTGRHFEVNVDRGDGDVRIRCGWLPEGVLGSLRRGTAGSVATLIRVLPSLKFFALKSEVEKHATARGFLPLPESVAAQLRKDTSVAVRGSGRGTRRERGGRWGASVAELASEVLAERAEAEAEAQRLAREREREIEEAAAKAAAEAAARGDEDMVGASAAAAAKEEDDEKDKDDGTASHFSYNSGAGYNLTTFRRFSVDDDATESATGSVTGQNLAAAAAARGVSRGSSSAEDDEELARLVRPDGAVEEATRQKYTSLGLSLIQSLSRQIDAASATSWISFLIPGRPQLAVSVRLRATPLRLESTRLHVLLPTFSIPKEERPPDLLISLGGFAITHTPVFFDVDVRGDSKGPQGPSQKGKSLRARLISSLLREEKEEGTTAAAGMSGGAAGTTAIVAGGQMSNGGGALRRDERRQDAWKKRMQGRVDGNGQGERGGEGGGEGGSGVGPLLSYFSSLLSVIGRYEFAFSCLWDLSLHSPCFAFPFLVAGASTDELSARRMRDPFVGMKADEERRMRTGLPLFEETERQGGAGAEEGTNVKTVHFQMVSTESLRNHPVYSWLIPAISREVEIDKSGGGMGPSPDRERLRVKLSVDEHGCARLCLDSSDVFFPPFLFQPGVQPTPPIVANRIALAKTAASATAEGGGEKEEGASGSSDAASKNQNAAGAGGQEAEKLYEGTEHPVCVRLGLSDHFALSWKYEVSSLTGIVRGPEKTTGDVFTELPFFLEGVVLPREKSGERKSTGVITSAEMGGAGLWCSCVCLSLVHSKTLFGVRGLLSDFLGLCKMLKSIHEIIGMCTAQGPCLDPVCLLPNKVVLGLSHAWRLSLPPGSQRLLLSCLFRPTALVTEVAAPMDSRLVCLDGTLPFFGAQSSLRRRTRQVFGAFNPDGLMRSVRQTAALRSARPTPSFTATKGRQPGGLLPPVSIWDCECGAGGSGYEAVGGDLGVSEAMRDDLWDDEGEGGDSTGLTHAKNQGEEEEGGLKSMLQRGTMQVGDPDAGQERWRLGALLEDLPGLGETSGLPWAYLSVLGGQFCKVPERDQPHFSPFGILGIEFPGLQDLEWKLSTGRTTLGSVVSSLSASTELTEALRSETDRKAERGGFAPFPDLVHESNSRHLILGRDPACAILLESHPTALWRLRVSDAQPLFLATTRNRHALMAQGRSPFGALEDVSFLVESFCRCTSLLPQEEAGGSSSAAVPPAHPQPNPKAGDVFFWPGTLRQTVVAPLGSLLAAFACWRGVFNEIKRQTMVLGGYLDSATLGSKQAPGRGGALGPQIKWRVCHASYGADSTGAPDARMGGGSASRGVSFCLEICHENEAISEETVEAGGGVGIESAVVSADRLRTCLTGVLQPEEQRGESSSSSSSTMGQRAPAGVGKGKEKSLVQPFETSALRSSLGLQGRFDSLVENAFEDWRGGGSRGDSLLAKAFRWNLQTAREILPQESVEGEHNGGDVCMDGESSSLTGKEGASASGLSLKRGRSSSSSGDPSLPSGGDEKKEGGRAVKKMRETDLDAEGAGKEQEGEKEAQERRDKETNQRKFCPPPAGLVPLHEAAEEKEEDMGGSPDFPASAAEPARLQVPCFFLRLSSEPNLHMIAPFKNFFRRHGHRSPPECLMKLAAVLLADKMAVQEMNALLQMDLEAWQAERDSREAASRDGSRSSASSSSSSSSSKPLVELRTETLHFELKPADDHPHMGDKGLQHKEQRGAGNGRGGGPASSSPQAIPRRTVCGFKVTVRLIIREKMTRPVRQMGYVRGCNPTHFDFSVHVKRVPTERLDDITINDLGAEQWVERLGGKGTEVFNDQFQGDSWKTPLRQLCENFFGGKLTVMELVQTWAKMQEIRDRTQATLQAAGAAEVPPPAVQQTSRKRPAPLNHPGASGDQGPSSASAYSASQSPSPAAHLLPPQRPSSLGHGGGPRGSSPLSMHQAAPGLSPSISPSFCPSPAALSAAAANSQAAMNLALLSHSHAAGTEGMALTPSDVAQFGLPAVGAQQQHTAAHPPQTQARPPATHQQHQSRPHQQAQVRPKQVQQRPPGAPPAGPPAHIPTNGASQHHSHTQAIPHPPPASGAASRLPQRPLGKK
uniref:Mediator of RNA polymerase II transcription subunit 14 n=1 Tax=Chromera velia CCMP2878 TaxID=1169474 RepID=A0A0G4I639_9ALVE|eukprot:Cvel_11275.t1-p1 / transcript=Cvel_11275.t1 / gene=Cvel_11275 / organism=Chromera_velia_CCMP2878 / gene_product=hypothetical protein / transcript_product=hypothetical protein / location=Cvel_scaffold703:32064-48343(-) / protein_length=2884 / sequence_SO=supercontig / SO=protein_coding / is_pseudo=false